MTRLRILRRLGRQGGYTLIELLLVCAILGTVLASLSVLFISASSSQIDMNRRFRAQQDARVAVDKMRREIHCSDQITPAGVSAAITVQSARPVPLGGRGPDQRHVRRRRFRPTLSAPSEHDRPRRLHQRAERVLVHGARRGHEPRPAPRNAADQHHADQHRQGMAAGRGHRSTQHDPVADPPKRGCALSSGFHLR